MLDSMRKFHPCKRVCGASTVPRFNAEPPRLTDQLFNTQVKELAECTFSPRTISLPAFMQRSSSMQSTMHSSSRQDLEEYAQQL